MVSGRKSTIIACATGKVRAGISIIRVSGPEAFRVTEALTRRPKSPARSVVNRDFWGTDNKLIDKGLVVFFQAPASFTGEDLVEFHTHGSPFIVEALIKQAVDLGCEMAKPGEFSERAFLNGKVDLVQAEAICDLIQSQTEKQAQAAAASLQGAFSDRIQHLAQKLEKIRVHLEASIDFSEQEPDTDSAHVLHQELEGLLQDSFTLLQDAQRGLHTQLGISVVLVGRPNVGKSSLLNHLTQQDTAIVTDIPGTTRDTIHANISYQGQLLTVTDTAGLRDSQDPVEAIGIQKTKRALETADCIWALVDCRDQTSSIQQEIDQLIPHSVRSKCTVIANKVDLQEKQAGTEGVDFSISAHTGVGVTDLLAATVQGCDLGEDIHFSARRRHIEALERFAQQSQKALACAGMEPELMAENLRYAQDALSEITGTYHNENLLDAIFRDFCLGK